MTRKNLLIACRGCKRLLQRDHFPASGRSLRANQHRVLCGACQRVCVACGLRKPQADFKGGEDECCRVCTGKAQTARSNVYYRFPVLKYANCPMSTDKFREIIADEERGGDDFSHNRRR
jgi:hypothetical protein